MMVAYAIIRVRYIFQYLAAIPGCLTTAGQLNGEICKNNGIPTVETVEGGRWCIPYLQSGYGLAGSVWHGWEYVGMIRWQSGETGMGFPKGDDSS